MTPKQHRQEIRARVQHWTESERRALRAIVDEHKRENSRQTTMALAHTIHELRPNLEQLRHVVGPALEGKSYITRSAGARIVSSMFGA
jgi:hypothetical protein